MLRTFIAVDFSPEIKESIKRLLTDIRNVPDKITWVRPENIHLTLKFLGPTPVEKREIIAQGLRQAVAGQPAFPVSMQGVGGFPSLGRPHVIWVGVQEGAQQLASLAQAVQDALIPHGFARDERPFEAHATLGRVKRPMPHSPLRQELEAYASTNFGQCAVKVITWYKSTLTPQGPVYEVLEQIPLYLPDESGDYKITGDR